MQQVFVKAVTWRMPRVMPSTAADMLHSHTNPSAEGFGPLAQRQPQK